ncbi:mycolipanoate synthase-like [Anneissia japonica]|uniref:mycolipanoate synthase-like n=1 Tax=Anneissia japonica TaxID=1529436 RepID=UPI00142586CB|nr:mycolipanoate synthase-like [Anneissia japonica]
MDGKIAITGIGCRYGDGVSGSREIWDMLKENRDCTGPHPANRFNTSFYLSPGEKKKGKIYTKAGGYLKQDPMMFDRQFFKMSPDEANHMDPQVRILLEVVWETLEDAGIPSDTLRGSNTGVYMGVTANEYITLTGLPQSNVSQYTNSGTNSCMISNRISYEFDLRGPSFSIDTACSSSLYAVQIACDALRGGICDTAIAGGVNIILTPTATIGFCQAGMLSPDGQCKSFDESANGYSRSEGAGSVVLKPLKRAIEDGDRIYAVIRGGALTNDGRTPGIANPSFDAQIDLVEKACAAAKVDPWDVAYIEAHGTGTPVGDRTEANAIGEAMGKRRADDAAPLFIGSIKSNVGHSEGAAGVAGVIKTALSLYHREIPGVANFKRGNPNINFKYLKLRVPTSITPWPVGSKLLAGCSSFGFGGANAHIVLEAPPVKQLYSQTHCDDYSSSSSPVSYFMLMLSAKSPKALQQKYVNWTQFLSNTLDSNPAVFQNALYTANMRAQHLAQRTTFIAKSRDELMILLKKQVNGEHSDTIIEGKAPEGNSINRTVFVFSGMGTQWWGMARQLMKTQPIFSNVIKLIDELLWKIGAKWSLVHILSDEEDKTRINDTEISQTCICSIQVGLVELYKHYGVTPSAIIGHSVGEVAAAYAAGLLSLATAIRIIFKRGHLLRKTSGSGTMAAVLHDIDDVQTQLKSTITYIDVAAINSPSQIVLSGKNESIKEFTSKLNEDGIQTRVLKVNNAFHSRQQEILKIEFYKKTKFLKKVMPSKEQRPLIPMMSTVTNSYLTLQEANQSDYWWANIRRPVQFKGAVEAILKDGYNSFIEIGAHPVLSPAIQDIVASKPNKPTIYFITHSLKRPRDISSSANDTLNINISLAQMYVNGYPVEMGPFFEGCNCEVVSLPMYPWQRVECSAATETSNASMRFSNSCHPLLGDPETSANYSQNPNLHVWKSKIGTDKEPWIADHVVQDSIIFPATGYIEIAIAAHYQLFTTAPVIVMSDLHFDRFLFVSETGILSETTTKIESNESAVFSFCSFNALERRWTPHSTMKLLSSANICEETTEHRCLPINDIINRCPGELDKSGFYANKKQVGFYLGEAFLCIEKANFSPVVDEALIYLRAPDAVAAQYNRFYVHPAFLDGIFQGMAGIERQQMKTKNPNAKAEGRVPRSVERIYFQKVVFPHNVLLHYTITSSGEDVYSDVYIAHGETYKIIGKFEKIRFGYVGSHTLYKQPHIWNRKWISTKLRKKSFDASGLTIITGDDEELSVQLQSTLTSVGILSKIDTNGGDKSEQVEQVGIENEPMSNVIIVIKPGNTNDMHTFSKEEFLEQQYQTASMCINQYNFLSSIEKINPNIWLITRDGFYVTKDDMIDPRQASAYGFGLSIIQEDVNFKLTILDIPSEIDTITTAKWLLEYIWKIDNDARGIALRNSLSDSTEYFDVFSLRLCVSKSDYFQHKLLSKKWKLDVSRSFQTGKLLTTACYALEDSISTQLITVNIESFQLLKSTTETTSEKAQPVVLFCGHSEQSRLVMGVCSARELRSTLHYKWHELISITSKLPAAQVINIVTSYFVPYMAVHDLPLDGTTVVCMSSNKDKQGLAVAHIAVELGHTAVVAVKDLSNENGVHLRSFKSVLIVDVKEICTVLDEQSVGCVIGSENVVSEVLMSGAIERKLKPFATIEILKSNKPSYRSSNFAFPVNAKVVMKNYELPLIEGFQQISPLIDKLLLLFERTSSIHPLQDVIPQIMDLKDVDTQHNISFNDVTFSFDGDAVPVNYDFAESKIKFSKHESYIVTGGTKGFGLCLVEWLASNGAGCINILSRSEPDSEAQVRLDCLRKSETTIVYIKTDITDRTGVESAFKRIVKDSCKPLSGIFHCAAQYDDRLIKDITSDNWKKVMAAKSWGALLLHRTSIKFNMQLKYFVMISSMVQMVGNTGQASYCAANRYLSSLLYSRRSKGLPATVFCPGIIQDTGFAAARKGLLDFWERKGIESLTAVELLNVLGVILLSDISEIGISGHFRVHDFMSSMSGLVKEYTNSDIDEIGFIELGFSLPSLDAREDEINLQHGDPDEAKLIILQSICGLISKRLGIASDISPDSSPSSLGVDSLMSTELSGVIQANFKVPLSPLELMNANMSVQALSALIYKRIMAKGKVGEQENEEDEDDTSWKTWYIMDEKVTSPNIQLICFPPNGGGPSVYAWWQHKLSNQNIQLIMAQLPGWEGRHLEKPLQNLDEITNQLTKHLVRRLIPGRFVLFGHSIGGLIAFEVAHLLKDSGLQAAHIIVSSWYAPTLGYPNAIDLERGPSILRQMEVDIKKNIRLTDNKAMRLSFLDDEVLSNPKLMRRLIPCFQVGFKICQKYTNTHNTKLQCGMTVLGAKSDKFVPPGCLDAWNLEIEPSRRFKKIVVSGGHMHIMSSKNKCFNEVQTALRDAFGV